MNTISNIFKTISIFAFAAIVFVAIPSTVSAVTYSTPTSCCSNSTTYTTPTHTSTSYTTPTYTSTNYTTPTYTTTNYTTPTYTSTNYTTPTYTTTNYTTPTYTAIDYTTPTYTTTNYTTPTYTATDYTTPTYTVTDYTTPTYTVTDYTTPTYTVTDYTTPTYDYPVITYTPPTYTPPTYTPPTPTCTYFCNPVVPPPPTYTPPVYPTCVISGPTSVAKGQSVTISWSSTNATRGNITNLGSNLPASGSHTIVLNQTTTFTGTFIGQNGASGNCYKTVTVTTPPVQYCPAGYTGTYPNCVPPVTQYCPAGYTGTYPNCVPPVYNPAPTCSIVINNNTYNNYTANQPVQITWSSNNAQYGSITSIGSVQTSGSYTVYPTQTTTYTGTFTGYNGQSANCSVTVNVGNTYIPTYPTYPATPYVTLSSVPYTGLDLGPVGTVLYWSFLVLWCLIVAYLIVVKRVQNKVGAWLNRVLFGTPVARAAAHTQTSVLGLSEADLAIMTNTIRSIIEGPAKTSAHTSHTASHIEVAKKADETDAFIISQINRSR